MGQSLSSSQGQGEPPETCIKALIVPLCCGLTMQAVNYDPHLS